MRRRSNRAFDLTLALALALGGGGCSAFSHANEPLEPEDAPAPAPRAPPPSHASVRVVEPRGKPDVLVLLALSGGGSRAAWFSAAVMLELEQVFADAHVNLLHEVDAISSVSGGSLAGAFYCVSKDPDYKARVRLEAPLRAPLPESLAEQVELDRPRHTLEAQRPISPEQANELKGLLARRDDPAERRRIDRLAELSQAQVSRRDWTRETVRDLMTRNYLVRWIWNCALPHHVAFYWFTAFDRADVMAETFADNLFDRPFTGFDLKLGELNPERPYLILNATDATGATRSAESDPGGGPKPAAVERFGDVFTFTTEDFTEKLNSDVNEFLVANAVMASAAFPAVFPFVTLRDYRRAAGGGGGAAPRYTHVFDGGNSDNLGLLSLKRVIDYARKGLDGRPPPRAYIVISVDAFTEPRGVDPAEADPRSFLDYFIDRNFLDAVDMLLRLNRFNVLAQYASPAQRKRLADQVRRAKSPGAQRLAQQWDAAAAAEASLEKPPGLPGSGEWEPRDLGSKLTFWPIRFGDVTDGALRARLNAIPTTFQITDEAVKDIEAAAHELVQRRSPEILNEIREKLGIPTQR